MNNNQIISRSIVTRLVIIVLIALILLFIAFQFIYIAGLLLGALGGISLGFVTVIKSFFESFVSAVGFLVFLFMMVVIFLVRNSTIRSISFNIAFIFLAICVFETYLYQQQKSAPIAIALNEVKVDLPKNFWSMNKYLGIVPTPNKVSRGKAIYNGEPLYDVTYTIDKHSHRISPPYIGGNNGKSLIFFGCSVTFGYGLEDDETFPYQVGKKLDNQYKIYNFSFGGYGTHQMLSQLEHGSVKEVVRIKPTYAIYTAIPDHLRRIVGDTPWGTSDPKYVIEDGKVIYKGLFSENTSSQESIVKKIRDSRTVNTLFGDIIERNRINLFASIVEASRDKTEALFPGCRFVVFFLDSYQPAVCDKMIEALQDKGIEVQRISDMIPHFFEKIEKYQIRSPVETHPNALSNKYVSDYVVNKLIRTSANRSK